MIDTAYVLDPIDNNWYDCDDSRVTKLENTNVITQAAYLLFYKKRGLKIDFEQVVKDAQQKFEIEREEELKKEAEATPAVMNYGWNYPNSQTQQLVGPWDQVVEVPAISEIETLTARNSSHSLLDNSMRNSSRSFMNEPLRNSSSSLLNDTDQQIDNRSFKSFEADAASTVNSFIDDDEQQIFIQESPQDEPIAEWPPRSKPTQFYGNH